VTDDFPWLAFFPAMYMQRERERRVPDAALREFAQQFRIVETG
jgi:hypothetical protein